MTAVLARWPRAGRVAAVVAVVLAVYGRTLCFGFSFLDDDQLILDQQAFLSQPSSLGRSFTRPYFQAEGSDHIFYRPLVTASLIADASWSGSNPFGYHVTNVVLHALAASLLFLLLTRLVVDRPNLAWAGGLVFAAHPALTEAVAWIPGRNDTLLTVFGLGSWLLFLRARDRAPNPRVWLSRVGHLLFGLAALFTKEAAVALPIAFALQTAVAERRPEQSSLRSSLRSWMMSVPGGLRRAFARHAWWCLGWITAIAVYLGARARVVRGGQSGLGARVGAGARAAALSLDTGTRNLMSLVQSLGQLLIPVQRAALATPEDTSLLPGAIAATLLAALLVAALFVPRVRRARADVLCGLACFVLFAAPGLPASGLLILESRLYLPAVAIAVGACTAARRVVDDPAHPGGANHLRVMAAVAAVAGAVLVLGGASFWYGGDFRDRRAFCEAAVRGSPHSALAHRNLGVTYQLAGDDELARREYDDALANDVAEPIVHNNLAVLLMARGQLVEAERELRAELAINPRYVDAHRNLARVLHAMGRADEAAAEQRIARALGLGPDSEATRGATVPTGPP